MTGSDVTVSCLVTTGMFSSEYLVKVESAGRVLWEGPADRELVFPDKDLEVKEDKYVRGRIVAHFLGWSYGKKSVIVEVASDGLAQGRRFEVPAEMVKAQKLPA